ncbi:MAG: hypothetical protein EOP11_02985 [Proteobacteria bacterium]|nr:MAG: hypothetical protein EOP11_02985 [Pseudomonadota bacterium]
MHHIASDTTSFEDLAAAFRYAANRVSELGQRFGFSVRGYDDATLPHFSALSLLERQKVVHALQGYLHSLEAGIRADKNLDQPHVSTWWAFSSLSLVPVADLFRHFQKDSVIEVFNLEGRQIWRNFHFFRYSSYTLEEMHCLEWPVLYDRGDAVTAQVHEYLERLIGGGPELVLPTLPEYVLLEKCSRDRMMIKVRHYLLSALKDRDGNLQAWIVCTKARDLAHGAKDLPPMNYEPRAGLRGRLSLVPPPEEI